jgi:hypothetical protein
MNGLAKYTGVTDFGGWLGFWENRLAGRGRESTDWPFAEAASVLRCAG